MVEVLVPLLSDEIAVVRQATAQALGLIGHASAIEALAGSLDDENEQVRYAVEQSLAQIDPGWMLRKGRGTRGAGFAMN
jgi:HEAT repeat protein